MKGNQACHNALLEVSVPRYPKTESDFKGLVGQLRNARGYADPILFAVGGRVVTQNGVLASVRYPVVNGFGQNTGSAAVLMHVLGVKPEGVQNVVVTREQLEEALRYFAPFKDDGKVHRNIKALEFAQVSSSDEQGVVATFIFDDVPPQGVEDVTLKLYAMSNRLYKPNTLNLDGIFGKLPNVAWEGDTPIDVDEVSDRLIWSAFGQSEYSPHMVDKFPLYVHRINTVEMGVRIMDQNKVRLGAYLGEGTTVMPGASYVNFNAGTEGKAMVEGRISSSAFVGRDTDIGGGASILGTLSGGNSTPITVGRNCLLEANSSLGIPIGDCVIIAMGTAVTASSHVRVRLEGHPQNGVVVKARDLAGISGVTFRRNDQDGALEVVRVRRNQERMEMLARNEATLNEQLHQNKP